MTRSLAAFLLALAAAACASRSHAGRLPPATEPAPVSTPAGAADSAGVAAAPAAEPSEEPTVRTPEQLARDAELARRAERVIDAYQNRTPGFGGALSHDGRTIFFGSNRRGSPQLYAGDVSRPRDPPVPITEGPERILTATLARDGKRILFTRDRGADENAASATFARCSRTAGQGRLLGRGGRPLRRPAVARTLVALEEPPRDVDGGLS